MMNKDEKGKPSMMVLALRKKEPEAEEMEDESLDDMLETVMSSEGAEKNKAIESLIARLESLKEEAA